MKYKLGGVLLSSEDIRLKVIELGQRLTVDYAGRSPLMICLLKGASVFFVDLIRQVKLDIDIDFIAASSYGGGTESSGKIMLIKDTECPLAGRDVIIVDDIIDSGNTLHYIRNIFLSRGASSVKLCAFLDKPSRRTANIEADYIGYSIPDEFVVGYGLDIAEKYRNLEEICLVECIQ